MQRCLGRLRTRSKTDPVEAMVFRFSHLGLLATAAHRAPTSKNLGAVVRTDHRIAITTRGLHLPSRVGNRGTISNVEVAAIAMLADADRVKPDLFDERDLIGLTNEARASPLQLGQEVIPRALE